MSKASTQEFDLQIQLSLVARIRHAAHMYKAAPSETAALRSYVSALECLAEYIAAKCRESQPTRETPLPAPRLRRHPLSEVAKPRTENRVIPFPSPEGAPLPAA